MIIKRKSNIALNPVFNLERYCQFLLYLSHGLNETGGYYHERFFAEVLAEKENLSINEIRFKKHYTNVIQHWVLLKKSFSAANAPVVVSVARLSIPVLLRNLFTDNRIFLVWHYHDKADKQGALLHFWYKLSLRFIKYSSAEKVKLVCVAPFWEKYFSSIVGSERVVMFPNFFDVGWYAKFRVEVPQKKKQVHLGQVSFKNSKDLIWLAKKLRENGYHCYYSTHQVENIYNRFDPNTEIKYFETHEAYLKEMAQSLYTLAMPAFHEVGTGLRMKAFW